MRVESIVSYSAMLKELYPMDPHQAWPSTCPCCGADVVVTKQATEVAIEATL